MSTALGIVAALLVLAGGGVLAVLRAETDEQYEERIRRSTADWHVQIKSRYMGEDV